MSDKKNRCTGCVWGRHVGTKIVCMFSVCVRDNGWVGDRVAKVNNNEGFRPSSIFMEKEKREA